MRRGLAVRWEPTTRKGPPPVWVERLRPLRERPGAWARVFVGGKASAYSVGNGIKHGKYRGLEPGQYEVSVRRLGEGGDEWGCWARYVNG